MERFEIKLFGIPAILSGWAWAELWDRNDDTQGASVDAKSVFDIFYKTLSFDSQDKFHKKFHKASLSFEIK